MQNMTQAQRVAEQVKANTAEFKFWFEDGSYAGIAVRSEGGSYDCYSRSDIFLGCAPNKSACRATILGY